MPETLQQIVASLPLRFEAKPLSQEASDAILGLRVPGRWALSLWRKLRLEAPNNGYWPVLIGTRQKWRELRREAALVQTDEIVATVALAESTEPHPVEWYLGEQRRLNQWALERGLEPEPLGLPDVGLWPDDERSSMELETLLALHTREPLKVVYVALVPTATGWTVPAHLGFGGWNDCPPPAVHCAIWRRWADLYEAHPVCVGQSTVEFCCLNPPNDEAAAIDLAREHYAYCYDIVDQGTGTIANLAGKLLNGLTWYFWWD